MQNCLEARGVLHIKRLSRDLSENFLSHLLPNLLRTDHEPNSAPPPSLPLHLHFLPLSLRLHPLPETQPASWAAAAVSLPLASPTNPEAGQGGRDGMFSGDWTPPCGSCCTKKYASLVQIPCQCLGPSSRAKELIWLVYAKLAVFSLPFFLSAIWYLTQLGVAFAGRVFCKKGCNADGDTWEECEYAYSGKPIAVVGSPGLRAELFGFRLACSGLCQLKSDRSIRLGTHWFCVLYVCLCF